MAKGYWLARVDVHNPDAYKAYVAANALPFRKFGARFLVRGGPAEVVEGQARARNVVLEFPSFDEAVACWHSPEYQRAKALRDAHATCDLIAVEGQEGQATGPGTMPKGYWIARVDVTNAELYQSYVAADAAAFDKYRARFLVRGGRFKTLEGESRARNIAFEFESQAVALSCYRSDDYQRAKRLREGNAIFELVIAEGYVGPQP